jgi:hypothetical protein
MAGLAADKSLLQAILRCHQQLSVNKLQLVRDIIRSILQGGKHKKQAWIYSKKL